MFCWSKPLTYETTIPFIPPVRHGRVIKVYDGDTITIGTHVYGTAYRFSVRLLGIDTPEMNGPHKEKAILARDELSALIFHKTAILKNVSLEKYGRLLADVYVDGIHINAWMKQKGHAVEYFGGKKPTERGQH
jgi:micrococcal nuclease